LDIDFQIPMARTIKVYGHSHVELPVQVQECNSLESTLETANTVILPISGINAAGMVRGYQTDQFIDFGRSFSHLSPGTLLVTGSLASRWLEVAAKNQIRVIQYAEDDTIAILNSIPTAEGAVQIALEQLPITIHGTRVLVAGFGRVGTTVARTFQGMGAQVTVAARRLELLARAKEIGYATVIWQQMETVLSTMQIIINTVPAVVFDETLLKVTAPEALIIDLASAPGGVDFDSAKTLGRKAIFAPGLPGKVAPQTAGKILALAIPELIIKAFTTAT
jgi:dipicolinate synthase subunit A